MLALSMEFFIFGKFYQKLVMQPISIVNMTKWPGKNRLEVGEAEKESY